MELTSGNVRRFFELPQTEDRVWIDMKAVRTAQDQNLYTKCGFTPYHGRRFQGWPVGIKVQGKTFSIQEEYRQKGRSESDREHGR